jgi:cardiolipin synthase
MSILWGFLILEGYLLTLLLVPVVLFQKKKASVSVLAWIMAILMLPYVGGILFLIFGVNRVTRRVKRRQESSQQLAPRLPGVARYELLPGEVDPQAARLMRLAERVSGYKPTYGNRVQVFGDTVQVFAQIEAAIRSAKTFIHLVYYIWMPDRLGTRLRDLLIEKAREGVRVRFLFDGWGSMRLRRQFLAPMHDAGIRTATTLPGASFRERWSINLRNHRKIVIVDGVDAFTGGANVGDSYVGRGPIGYWRDTHLHLTGPAVLQLAQIFAEDWYYATGEELTGPEYYPDPELTGDQVCQVVAGGPDNEAEVFHALFFAALNEANDRITIQTSFFVPTPPLVAALESAAMRGVNVRVMLSGNVEIFGTLTAARAYYGSLLDCGVEIYEYTKGLLHSKTVTIDGRWSLVGSPNFDARSVQLNFEVAVAMDGPRVAEQLEQHFQRDLEDAVRIDPAAWHNRGWWPQLQEQSVKLFSPIL